MGAGGRHGEVLWEVGFGGFYCNGRGWVGGKGRRVGEWLNLWGVASVLPVVPWEGCELLSEKQILECELLVVRWQRGERAAFGELVRMWERSLFYYLRRIVATEADAWELLQETWLKVYRSLGTLREARALPAFLYTTARHLAVSRMRGRGSAEGGDGALAEAEAAGDESAALENAEAVHRALDRVPLAQREVLTLFFLEELSLEEIATVLGVPVGTVKSRLHYGKAALSKILKGAEDGR